MERWLLQSKEELEAAQISFEAKKWFAVAFWCEQSVEKALKALYIEKKKESAGTTHALTYLGREVNIPQEYQEALRDLTKEYYLSRYPDASEDIPFKMYRKEDAERYLNISKKIRTWVDSQQKKQ